MLSLIESNPNLIEIQDKLKHFSTSISVRIRYRNSLPNLSPPTVKYVSLLFVFVCVCGSILVFSFHIVSLFNFNITHIILSHIHSHLFVFVCLWASVCGGGWLTYTRNKFAFFTGKVHIRDRLHTRLNSSDSTAHSAGRHKSSCIQSKTSPKKHHKGVCVWISSPSFASQYSVQTCLLVCVRVGHQLHTYQYYTLTHTHICSVCKWIPSLHQQQPRTTSSKNSRARAVFRGTSVF